MLGYDDLRYFQKIAEIGSLRKASQALKISQPSLSYTIKKIENELGTQLLHRSQKGVMLTEPGHIFFKKIDHLLDYWSKLNCEVTRETNRELWQITIGCHPSVANYSLTKILPKLLKKYPLLRIKLKHDLSRKINEEVVESKIDLGLIINPISQPELIIKPLTTDIVTLWESKENENKETLILNSSLAQTQWLLRKIEKEGIKFKRLIESNNLDVIAGLTLSGSGVGILPSRVLEGKAIKKFTEKDLFFQDNLCATYRPEFKNKFVAKEIIEALENSFIKNDI